MYLTPLYIIKENTLLYNLRIVIRIFQPQIGCKIRILQSWSGNRYSYKCIPLTTTSQHFSLGMQTEVSINSVQLFVKCMRMKELSQAKCRKKVFRMFCNFLLIHFYITCPSCAELILLHTLHLLFNTSNFNKVV